jgi:nitrate/nitrite transporter NarK
MVNNDSLPTSIVLVGGLPIQSLSMRRVVFMLTLILAGELIFGLPYHTTRFFRPTFLQVFELSNTQLGDMFAVYGITAMLAYFPGGVIADHYSPRSLMTLSLFATAAGGLYMATFPGHTQLALLYGFWGISTILLFWSAMISATREWGGKRSQGKAFGVLDGGRGLVAAAFAVLAVAVLSLYMPADMSQISESQRLQGFRTVILLYSAATALAGCLIWLVLPKSMEADESVVHPLAGMLTVMRRPIVWAQAMVIVCAYCGFKGSDNYSLYAVQVLGMDEVAAAKFTAYASYLRPVGAVVAGIVADRFSTSKIITITFIILVFSYSILAVASPSASWTYIIFANLLISYFGVFALRGIYFALLEESKTPKYLTGSTVGFISLVGYTPDIFFAPIGGRLLDSASVLVGHQRYFMFLAALAMLGVLAIAWLIWLKRRQSIA